MHNYQEVIDFWFRELSSKLWFKKDKFTDQLIKERFSNTHKAAVTGEVYKWRQTALGRLAEIIVIDQFSRNIFRDGPKAYLYDSMALVLSQEAIRIDTHKKITPQQRSFLYMPFMHSESRMIHKRAIELFSEPDLKLSLEFEYKHKKIIDKFGRYPHRNKVLGRTSTPEEITFLKEKESSL